MQETWVGPLAWEETLKKGMATHSSILAWEIPWTEEPGGLQSRGLSDTTEQLNNIIIWVPVISISLSYCGPWYFHSSSPLGRKSFLNGPQQSPPPGIHGRRDGLSLLRRGYKRLPSFSYTLSFWLSSSVCSDRVRGKSTLWETLGCFQLCWLLSCVWLFATLWTVAHQTPLSMGFSR